MQFFFKFPSRMTGRWVFASFLAFLFPNALAQQNTPDVSAILARDPSGARVSVADILSELQRASPAERQTFLSKPEDVHQMASNLLLRRVLAAQAERDGRGTDPVVAATLAIARDRVLSDTQLARLDLQRAPGEAVLEANARDYYQANKAKFERPVQTRARHILLSSGAESLQKAKNLLVQLHSGSSFEELAKANSIDTGSAAKGGDLGFFGPGKMAPEFEEALNKLSKPGDLSEPVESHFGYHIIRLEERQEKTMQPFSEVREQLLAEARMAILNASRSQTIRLLSKDFVFDDGAISALAKPTAN